MRSSSGGQRTEGTFNVPGRKFAIECSPGNNSVGSAPETVSQLLRPENFPKKCSRQKPAGMSYESAGFPPPLSLRGNDENVFWRS